METGKRTMDLAIAATANVYGVPPLTEGARDFAIIADLVNVRTPGESDQARPLAGSRSRPLADAYCGSGDDVAAPLFGRQRWVPPWTRPGGSCR